MTDISKEVWISQSTICEWSFTTKTSSCMVGPVVRSKRRVERVEQNDGSVGGEAIKVQDISKRIWKLKKWKVDNATEARRPTASEAVLKCGWSYCRSPQWENFWVFLNHEILSSSVLSLPTTATDASEECWSSSEGLPPTCFRRHFVLHQTKEGTGSTFAGSY